MSAIDFNQVIKEAQARRLAAQAESARGAQTAPAAPPAPVAPPAPAPPPAPVAPPAPAAPRVPNPFFDPTPFAARTNTLAPATGAPTPATVFAPGVAPDHSVYTTDATPLGILGHSMQATAQGVGRGLADAAGTPVDLPIAGANALGWLYNQGAGPLGLPQSPGINWSLADQIANGASWLATKAGAPPMQRWEMTPAEQGVQKPLEWGTAALTTGLGLAARTPKMAADLASGPVAASFFDKLSLPYLNRPVAAAARDFGTGVGAAEGSDLTHAAVDKFAPGNTVASTVADVIGSIMGGMGGHTLGAGVAATPRLPSTIFSRLSQDKNIPVDPVSGQSYSRAQSDLAARVFQGDATDPTKAANTIRQNSADLTAGGTPPGTLLATGPTGAQPTSGLLSGDQGLVNLETSFRTRQPADFQIRDQAVKGEAANRIGKLSNPSADQSTVGPAIQAETAAMRTDRDMAALPYLQKAESAGVVVDPKPIVDLIDNKLAITKREPVVAALTKAKKALYVVGTDPKNPQLDTTVSGLYEARKVVNDIIAGKSDSATARFADKELIQVRDQLDAAITKVAPEFGDYLTKFTQGSAPLDAVKENTAAQTLINGKDPRDVANTIMNGYGGADEAKAVSALVANDPAAAAGWKAAVGEVLVNKVTNTNVINGDYQGSYAALSRTFKQNEDKLAAVFAPDEMANLQQAQKLLSYFKAADVKATTGSDTATNLLRTSEADRFAGGPMGRGVELVLKHVYGNLQGGGAMRRFKLMVSLLPTDRSGATEIAKLAFFNPDVAAYLLGKPVKNLAAIPNNNGLRNAIAADIAEQDNASNNQP